MGLAMRQVTIPATANATTLTKYTYLTCIIRPHFNCLADPDSDPDEEDFDKTERPNDEDQLTTDRATLDHAVIWLLIFWLIVALYGKTLQLLERLTDLLLQ